MRHIGNRQQCDLGAIESATAGTRPRFGFGAARFGFLVMLACRFVQQLCNILGLHGTPENDFVYSYCNTGANYIYLFLKTFYI